MGETDCTINQNIFYVDCKILKKNVPTLLFLTRLLIRALISTIERQFLCQTSDLENV